MADALDFPGEVVDDVLDFPGEEVAPAETAGRKPASDLPLTPPQRARRGDSGADPLAPPPPDLSSPSWKNDRTEPKLVNGKWYMRLKRDGVIVNLTEADPDYGRVIDDPEILKAFGKTAVTKEAQNQLRKQALEDKDKSDAADPGGLADLEAGWKGLISNLSGLHYVAGESLGADIEAAIKEGRPYDYGVIDAQREIYGDDKFLEMQRQAQDAWLAKTAEYHAAEEAVGIAPSVQRFNNAKTWGEVWDALAADPYVVTRSTVLRSAPQSLPSVVGSIAGSLAGPMGAAAGAGIGSYGTELGSSIGDGLEEYGADMNDPQSIRETWAAHGKDIMKKAQVRAVIIGAVDAATGGLTTKIVGEPAKTTLGNLGKATLGTGVQAVSGATGEGAARLATGDPLDAGPLAGEMLGEAGSGGAEVAGQSIVGTLKAMRGGESVQAKTGVSREERGQTIPKSGLADLTDLATEEDDGRPAPGRAPWAPGSLRRDFEVLDFPGDEVVAEPDVKDERKAGDATEPEKTGNLSTDETRAELRRRGWTHAEIDAMPPDEVAAIMEDGMATAKDIDDEGDDFPGKDVGSRHAPAAAAETELESARARVAEEPTDGQIEAGNYRMGHAKVHGLPVSIETARGGVRRSKSDAPAKWSVKMQDDYGRFKGTKGADGEEIDVFLGPDLAQEKAFIIDQADPDTGKFDEHKVIMGAETEEEARAIYSRGFSDGKGEARIQAVTEFSIPDLKNWLAKPQSEPVRGKSRAPAAVSAEGEAAVRAYISDGGALNAEALARKTGRPIEEAGRMLTHAANKGMIRMTTKGRFLRKPKPGSKPVGLIAFLADAGGIVDHKGEVKALDLHKRLTSSGPLVRPTGMALDEAREAAVEAEYLPDGSTIDDLLQALDREGNRDKAVYPRAEQARADEAADKARTKAGDDELQTRFSAKERAFIEKHGYDVFEQLDRLFNQTDADWNEWTEADLDKAAGHIKKGMEADDALERAAMEFYEENLPEPEVKEIEDEVARPQEASEAAEEAGRDSAESGDKGEDAGGRDEVREPVKDDAGKGEPEKAVENKKIADIGEFELWQSSSGAFEVYDATSLRRTTSSELKAREWIERHLKPEPKPEAKKPEVFSPYETTKPETKDEFTKILKADNRAEGPDGKVYWLDRGTKKTPSYVYKAQSASDGISTIGDGEGWGVEKAAQEAARAAGFEDDLGALFDAALDEVKEQRGEKASQKNQGIKRDAKPDEDPKIPAGMELTYIKPLTKDEREGTPWPVGAFKALVTTKKPWGVHEGRGETRAAAISSALADARKYVKNNKPAEQKPGGPRYIGKNRSGFSLYEDENGVRSYVESGIRITEPVMLDPRGGFSIETPRRPDFEPVATQTVKAAVKSAAMGLDAVASGLTALFGDPNKLGTMGAFDEETYAKALPFFRAGVAHFRAAGADIAALMRSLVQHLANANMPTDAIARMKPYAIRFVEDVKAGKVSLDDRAVNDTVVPEGKRPPGQKDGGAGEPSGKGSDSGVAPPEAGDGGRDGSGGRPKGSGSRSQRGDAGQPQSKSERGDDADRRPGGSGEGLADAGRGPDEPTPSAIRPNFFVADPDSLIGGTPKVRFARNRKAIETYRILSDEGREPTQEELATIAGYIGWGSFGQELFQGNWTHPQPKDGWEKEDTWLRQHLGQSEWESAQRSIINAHYTDPPTVKVMWDMVRRMGFLGGRVLEPSMGIGNFFGLMPRDLMDKSDLTGIELDELTGGMAKLLYPRANIQIKGYEKSKTPDNFYDLVIGNWPFAKDGPSDRRYDKLALSLHDYFFVKAIDQVRPGGIVIGITSSGTIDKIGRGARMAMQDRADLIGVYRLPSGAFEKYAGTSVVTDIIIFRKRAKGDEPVPVSWLDTEPLENDQGLNVQTNVYWKDHKADILGKMTVGHGTTRGKPGMIVNRPDNFMQLLESLPERVPENIYQPIRRGKEPRFMVNNTADREGSIVLTDKGEPMVVQGERLATLRDLVTDLDVKDRAEAKSRLDQVRRLANMRKAYGALLDAERDSAEDVEAVRKRLNDLYKEFRKEHGTIKDSIGIRIMQKVQDPFAAALRAIETPEGKPSRILSESTVRQKKKLTAPTVKEAFVLARNEGVTLDLARIAEMAGKPIDDVTAELIDSKAIYRTPGGGYEVSDVFLSGNVRRKLAELLDAKERGENVEASIEAIKTAIPKDVPYFQIEAKMGATWIPNAQYNNFAAELIGLANNDKGFNIYFKGGGWKVKVGDNVNRRPEAMQWGHTGAGGRYAAPMSRVVKAALNGNTITMQMPNPDPDGGGSVIDPEATKAVNEKVTRMRELFSDWVWKDSDRKLSLERSYNDVMNAIATPRYDGSFLEFSGMALRRGDDPLSLRQHQVNAIWRGIANRRGLYAHEVGTGKTYTMGGIAIESRRYGIARKPILFAHNANSATVAAEIQEQYPGAQILYIDNLSGDTVETSIRRITNDDWDLIVMPHSLLDRIGLSEATLMELAKEEIAALENEAMEAAAEDNSSITVAQMDDEKAVNSLRSVTAKNLVHARNAILKRIKDMANAASREGALIFEDTGIDMVLVDEVHEFKKPPLVTKRKMRGLNTATSNRSIAMRLITDYVKRMNDGGNVHIFTGTPITNTLTEIYNMMRYVADDQMALDGIKDWDPWFATFADATSDVELTAAGTFEPVTRLASFVNVAELRRMAGQFLDIIFASDMPEFSPRKTSTGKTMADKLTDAERFELENGRNETAIGRPYKKVIPDVGPMSPEQEVVLNRLAQLATDFKNDTPLGRKRRMMQGDESSPVIVETNAANAGLDVRLYDMKAEDHPASKVNRAVKNIVGIYKGDKLATQVVFMERGYSDKGKRTIRGVKDKNGNKVYETVDKFNLVKDLVKKLVAGGVREDQIAIVTGATSKQKRREIAKAMNRSEIRVVIGLTSTLGIGVNMQRYLRALHHMDAPWTPGELEQRNGRGERQGNSWNTVLEYRYITEKLDGRRWQVLAVKDRFIKAFLKADESVRIIEGDAVDLDEGEDAGSLAQTLSLAAGDPRILLVNKFKADVERLQNRQRQHLYGIDDARSRIKEIRSNIIEGQKAADLIERDVDALKATADAEFEILIDGKQYTKREDANKALEVQEKIVANDKSMNGGKAVQIGSYRGLYLFIEKGYFGGSMMYLRSTASKFDYGVNPSVASFDAKLRSLPKMIAERRDIAEREASIARLEEMTKQPFSQEKTLETKQRLLAELEVDLQRNPVPAPSWLRQGAPVNTLIYVGGKPREVQGHRWDDQNYWILTPEGDVPYTAAKAESGMALYDKREFAPPVRPTINKGGQAGAPAKAAAGAVLDSVARPLSVAQFKRTYPAAHIDLRGREKGTAQQNREAILRDGFKPGAGMNTLPPWMGGKPVNVVEIKFMPKKGDVVYLVPKDWWIKKEPERIKAGWQPKPFEAVTIEYDGQSLYEAYAKAVQEWYATLDGPVTSTKQFKEWFGKSKIVNEDGTPRVVYKAMHGFTPNMQRETGMTHVALDQGVAEQFAGDPLFGGGLPERRVQEVYVKAEKPFDFRDKADLKWLIAEMRKPENVAEFNRQTKELMGPTYDFDADEDYIINGLIDGAYQMYEIPMVSGMIRKRGYDAIYLTEDLQTEEPNLAVFSPAQIKSATRNRGTFDPNSPSILESVARPFYSAVVRAIETAKTTKAPAAQWLATIRNTPGVKAEELEWIGLEDWLKKQEGSVTREAVADFARANQISVQEVLKGPPPPDSVRMDDLREKTDRTPEEEAELQSYYEAANRAQGETFASLIAEYDAWVTENRLPQMSADELIVEPRTTETQRDWLSDYLMRWRLLEDQQEAPLGRGTGNPRYAQYTLRGGANYRELLLTLPERDRVTVEPSQTADGWGTTEGGNIGIRRVGDRGRDYRSGHWDEPNILAHVRFNERTDADGKSVLFIEEIQSDWHQAGRRRGYSSEAGKAAQLKTEFEALRVPIRAMLERNDLLGFDTNSEARSALMADNPSNWEYETPEDATLAQQFHDAWASYRQVLALEHGMVPDAPFKTTWPELAFKRIVRWAAEYGYDRIAWTPGIVQVRRYTNNFRQEVSNITWALAGDVRRVSVQPTRSRAPMLFNISETGKIVDAPEMFDQGEDGQNVEDLFGKEIARQIMEQNTGTIEGEGLTIGGEGMRGFYDKMLVDLANKMGKKFGAKVGRTTIALPADTPGKEKWRERLGFQRNGRDEPAHSLDIPPAMADAAMAGQPLFQVPAHRQPGFVSKYAFVISNDQRIEIADTVDDVTKRILGDRITAEVIQQFKNSPNQGSFNTATRHILIAIGAALDPYITLGHESIHALRELGVFTKAEWATLREWAIKDLEGSDLPGLYARYRQRFNLTDEQFQELLIEEAIADAFGEFLQGNLKGNAPRPILARLRSFLKALGNALRGKGFNTVGSIFRRINAGEMRDRQFQEGRSFSLDEAAQASPVDSAAFKKWFGKSKVVGRDGRPLRVYHGTASDFDAFSKDFQGTSTKTLAASSAFWFSSSPANAEAFARWSQKDEGMRPQIMPVYLSMQNPLIVPAGKIGDGFDVHLNEARFLGHDGVIFRDVIDSPDHTELLVDGYVMNVDYRGMFVSETFPGFLDGSVTREEAQAELDDAVMNAMEELESASRAERDDYEHQLEVWTRIRDAFRANPKRVGLRRPPKADVFAVFKPTQIKSPFNKGTFSPKKPGILDSVARPGGFTQEQAQAAREIASNINLDYIAAPEDIKAVIADVSERAGHFMGARRGVVSNMETRALARDLGMSTKELTERKHGSAFNAEGIFAARVLLVKSATRLRELAARARRTERTSDLAEFQKAWTVHVAIQEQVAGLAAEAGRALQQFKMMAGDNYFKAAQKIVEANKVKNPDEEFGKKTKEGADALLYLVDMVDAMDDPAQLNKFTRDAHRATIGDMIREAWINALLSGFRTHATNILSNTLTALYQVPETAIASLIGSLHGGEKVQFAETSARLVGLIEGAREGLRAGATAFRTGDPSDLTDKLDSHRYRAIPGPLGEIIRIPSRALLAEDEVFKAINYRAEINAQAVRIAMGERKRGQSLARRIAELKAYPTTAMKTAAHRAALYNTFQTDLGAIGRGVMWLRNRIPGAWILIPFIKTPANILKYAVERTPLPLLGLTPLPIFKEIAENLRGKNGNVARDVQMARMGLGTSIMVSVMALTMAGFISGGGPEDKKEKALLRMSGWQPYSIRVGDTWYSYQRLDPFGLLLGISADLVELGEAASQQEWDRAATLILASVMGNLREKTWLKGVSDFFEAFFGDGPSSEWDRDAYLRNLGGTLVPNMVNQIAQVTDPYLRETRSLVDVWKSRIPGLSSTLLPRRDIFGEPIKKEGALGPDLLSPIFISTDKHDKVVEALIELHFVPSKPRREINGHQLTPELYDEYSEMAGKAAKKALDRKVGLPSWKTKDPDERTKAIREIFDEARDDARDKMKKRHPELKKKPK